MPIRNEAVFIAESLGAVLAQDYPQERMEVIVADGGSTDGTQEILAGLQEKHSNLRIINNPNQIVPTGFNAALEISCGEIIIRIDGHSLVAEDFVRQDVAVMAEHPEAWSVGGPIIHRATTAFGNAVAVAMSHPLGIGNARHHFAGYEGYGEGVPFPAIRRWVFDRIGPFDEQLVRNNDDEFNYRMTRSGGKIFITPRVRYDYFVREQAGQLFRQYFQYGFWRIPVIKKHKQPTTLRQIIPSVFYLACFGGLAMGVVLSQAAVAVALPLFYLTALLVCALSVLPKGGLSVALRVPLAIAILHCGYAFGLIYGVWASFCHPAAWDTGTRMRAITR